MPQESSVDPDQVLTWLAQFWTAIVSIHNELALPEDGERSPVLRLHQSRADEVSPAIHDTAFEWGVDDRALRECAVLVTKGDFAAATHRNVAGGAKRVVQVLEDFAKIRKWCPGLPALPGDAQSPSKVARVTDDMERWLAYIDVLRGWPRLQVDGNIPSPDEADRNRRLRNREFEVVRALLPLASYCYHVAREWGIKDFEAFLKVATGWVGSTDEMRPAIKGLMARARVEELRPADLNLMRISQTPRALIAVIEQAQAVWQLAKEEPVLYLCRVFEKFDVLEPPMPPELSDHYSRAYADGSFDPLAKNADEAVEKMQDDWMRRREEAAAAFVQKTLNDVGVMAESRGLTSRPFAELRVALNDLRPEEAYDKAYVVDKLVTQACMAAEELRMKVSAELMTAVPTSTATEAAVKGEPSASVAPPTNTNQQTHLEGDWSTPISKKEIRTCLGMSAREVQQYLGRYKGCVDKLSQQTVRIRLDGIPKSDADKIRAHTN